MPKETWKPEPLKGDHQLDGLWGYARESTNFHVVKNMLCFPLLVLKGVDFSGHIVLIFVQGT